MPELPDLLHIRSKLREALVGWHVASERVREPVVLRFAVRGNLSLLLGRPLQDIVRKSHFLVFRFEGLDLAVNPMLAGRFRVCAPEAKDEASMAFALGFSLRGTPDGRPAERELRYLDDKKMGKAYLIATEDWKAIPGMQTGGVDILGPEFTPRAFREPAPPPARPGARVPPRQEGPRQPGQRLRRRGAVRGGHPSQDLLPVALPRRRRCRLHDAIVKVMTEAVAEVAGARRAHRREGARLPEGAPQGHLSPLRIASCARRG